MPAFLFYMQKKENETIMTEEKLTARGADIFKSSSNWLSENIIPRWKDSNDLYNGKFKNKKGSKEVSDALIGQGRLFIPKTYSHVQRILVDMLDTYFVDPEEVLDVVSWKSIPTETREIVKALLCYRLNGHPINFYHEAYEACLDALKNKVGIFQVFPNIKTRTEQVPIPVPVPESNPIMGGMMAGDMAQSPDMQPPLEDVPHGTIPPQNPQYYERTVIESFTPQIDCLPYEDVFFDPRATWKDYWRFPIVHRMRKSIDYLKRRGYKNLDDLQPAQTIDGVDEIKMQRNRDNASPFTANTDIEVTNQNEIFIYVIWDFIDVNNDGLLESCSYIMAGDESNPNRIIRDIEENTLPYKREGEDYNRPPIVMGQAFPEPHQLMGKDLPEIVEGLQKETNAIRNQRREAVALAIRKPILVNRGANIDIVSLLNRRIGAVVQGDDISTSSIREMEVSDPTNSSIQEMAKVDSDFFETTSIAPNLLGMPSQAGETATGVTSHVANANKKIAQIIRNLAYTLFIPTFQMLLRLEQEYENDNFVAMVTGKILGWQLAQDDIPSRAIIQGDFDLSINISMTKQAQINKWMMLFDRSVQANQATMGLLQAGVVDPNTVSFVNTMKLFQKMLPLVGEKAIEEYMTGALPPPLQPMPANNKGIASQPILPTQIGGAMLSQNPGGM